MLTRQDVARLMDDTARELECPVADVFVYCCILSDKDPSPDPDLLWENWIQRYEAPEWFIDVMIGICSRRISILSVKKDKDKHTKKLWGDYEKKA